MPSTALVVAVVSIFGANLHELIRIVKSGAIVAGVALVAGAFGVGALQSRRDRSVELGLRTAQRNVAGAMLVASRDFTNPDILLMITATEDRRATHPLPHRLAFESASAARGPANARTGGVKRGAVPRGRAASPRASQRSP
jgi:hypothetical protein